MEDFISQILGKQYLFPPGFDIAKSFMLSKQNSPLLFILVPGINPVSDIFNYASSQDMHAHLEVISLGEGQDILAENAIKTALIKGNWLCLQNCHLAGPWLLKLEDIIDNSFDDNLIADEGFRLWLTTLPSTEACFIN
ncbi:hypothetical protein J437_LFUL019724 [Ladona fulva]|nr:hypothetical protein J437_LFUL019724 [Ladona fulva]